jgi:hypothetical protein
VITGFSLQMKLKRGDNLSHRHSREGGNPARAASAATCGVLSALPRVTLDPRIREDDGVKMDWSESKLH